MISQTTTQDDIQDIAKPGDLSGWYYLDTAQILTRQVSVSLYFSNEQLNRIEFFLEDPMYGESWDDWSESKEFKRVGATKMFLKELGYTKERYSWGEVWVGYDSKAGFGYGGISFKMK